MHAAVRKRSTLVLLIFYSILFYLYFSTVDEKYIVEHIFESYRTPWGIRSLSFFFLLERKLNPPSQKNRNVLLSYLRVLPLSGTRPGSCCTRSHSHTNLHLTFYSRGKAKGKIQSKCIVKQYRVLLVDPTVAFCLSGDLNLQIERNIQAKMRLDMTWNWINLTNGVNKSTYNWWLEQKNKTNCWN